MLKIEKGGVAQDFKYVFKGAIFYWGAHYFDYLWVITKEGDAWA